jgi:hypothetical protein
VWWWPAGPLHFPPSPREFQAARQEVQRVVGPDEGVYQALLRPCYYLFLFADCW